MENDISGATRPRILVVEDDDVFRELLCDCLTRVGAIPIPYNRAEDAWQYMLHGGIADLAFVDYFLPGRLDGGELAERMYHAFPWMELVVSSACPEQVTLWEHTIIGKSFQPDRLAIDLFERASRTGLAPRPTGAA